MTISENQTLWTFQETGTCPVAETLHILGGKHKPQILHCLASGEKHFLELNRLLGDISRKVLTSQLKDLQAANIITRVQKDDPMRKVGYSLTSQGKELVLILSQMNDWAISHLVPSNKDKALTRG